MDIDLIVSGTYTWLVCQRRRQRHFSVRLAGHLGRTSMAYELDTGRQK